MSQDLITVTGGNTANLLAVWRVHGVDEVLEEAWRRGAVLAGLSAGSLCWFEAGISDSFGHQLELLDDGLGLLPGAHCPHFDGEALRRPRTLALLEAGAVETVWAADDGAALRFSGAELAEVVSSRPAAGAYRLWREGGKLREERPAVRFLGVAGAGDGGAA